MPVIAAIDTPPAGLTAAWQTGARDSPKGNLTDVCAIAEIVSRFDVVAIQRCAAT